MAAIGWNNVGYNPVSVNPSAALATASSAAKSLADGYAKEQEMKSLADYRQQSTDLALRKQDFVEGEPDRAILAEQQKFDLTRQRAGDQSKDLFGIQEGIVQKQREAFKFSPQTIKELQNNQLFQQLPELAQNQYMATSLGEVKDRENSFIDKKLFGSDYRQAITNAGYSEEVANSAVDNYNKSNFGTGSLDIAKLQINAMGKPISDAAQVRLLSGGNGRGINGSNGYFDVNSAIKADEFTKDFYSDADDRSSIAGAVGADTNLLDWNSNEVYKDRVRTTIGDLASFGINEVSGLKALQSIAIKDGVIIDRFKGINTDKGLSVPLMKELVSKANDFQKLGQRGGSQAKNQEGILGGLIQAQSNRSNNINSILNTLTNTGPGQKGRSSALSNDKAIRSFAKKYGYNLPTKDEILDKSITDNNKNFLFSESTQRADNPNGSAPLLSSNGGATPVLEDSNNYNVKTNESLLKSSNITKEKNRKTIMSDQFGSKEKRILRSEASVDKKTKYSMSLLEDISKRKKLLASSDSAMSDDDMFNLIGPQDRKLLSVNKSRSVAEYKKTKSFIKAKLLKESK